MVLPKSLSSLPKPPVLSCHLYSANDKEKRMMVLMLKVAQGKVERGGQGSERGSYLQTPLIGCVDVLIIGV